MTRSWPPRARRSRRWPFSSTRRPVPLHEGTEQVDAVSRVQFAVHLVTDPRLTATVDQQGARGQRDLGAGGEDSVAGHAPRLGDAHQRACGEGSTEVALACRHLRSLRSPWPAGPARSPDRPGDRRTRRSRRRAGGGRAGRQRRRDGSGLRVRRPDSKATDGDERGIDVGEPRRHLRPHVRPARRRVPDELHLRPAPVRDRGPGLGRALSHPRPQGRADHAVRRRDAGAGRAVREDLVRGVPAGAGADADADRAGVQHRRRRRTTRPAC